jgi:hypothetical protein
MRKTYLALMVFLVVSAFVASSTVEAYTPSQDQFSPSKFNIPDTIGDFRVIAVLNEDNFLCLMPGEKRLVLQAVEPSAEGVINSIQKVQVEQVLEGNNLSEYSSWGWDIIGPGITRGEYISQLQQSYRLFRKEGCLKLGGLAPTSSKPDGAEIKVFPPHQGFAVVQDTDAGKFADVNAQSVYLVAPAVGTRQEQNSGLLNNVMTDSGDYFLQDGFAFWKDSAGQVIWTDTSVGLYAQPFNIAYKVGNPYWMTITYSFGTWWQCAEDVTNLSTYVCHAEPNGTGTHLKLDVNTSIFAENWNPNKNWFQGFSPLMQAYGAAIYINGIGQSWSSQDTWTEDACFRLYPPRSVISGSLVNGGTVNFVTAQIPLYCR